MSKGKVKEYNSNRGYGTIIDIDTGQNLTVYANYVLLKKDETLKSGQDVEYEIQDNRGENWAVNVKILLVQPQEAIINVNQKKDVIRSERALCREELLQKTGTGVFSLVRIAMIRALELASGKPCLINNPSSDKTTITVLEEISQGKIGMKIKGKT